MEFRYRAIDGDRRPPPATDTPPNPIISFLSARPVPGYIREIDKEQIRNDIIVAETARRRELMAQVLQEMATSGVSLEDMQSMWINNQREPLLPNNHSLLTSPLVQKLPEDKLIVLERPESVGAKRKAEEDPTGIESAKRNAAGLCLATDLCLPCPENKGKETVSPKLSPCLGEEGGSKPSFKLWCDICKVGTFCEKVMRDHELGKKHLAATGGEAVSRKLPPSWGEEVESKPILKFKLWCDICNVGTFCEKVMRDHELGKKHLAAIEQKKVVETELKETGKKKKAWSWCEVCNISLCSEKVMETHRLGKKHKALHEKQQRRPLAVLDTNLMTTTRMNGDPVEKGQVLSLEN